MCGRVIVDTSESLKPHILLSAREVAPAFKVWLARSTEGPSRCSSAHIDSTIIVAIPHDVASPLSSARKLTMLYPDMLAIICLKAILDSRAVPLATKHAFGDAAMRFVSLNNEMMTDIRNAMPSIIPNKIEVAVELWSRPLIVPTI